MTVAKGQPQGGPAIGADLPDLDRYHAIQAAFEAETGLCFGQHPELEPRYWRARNDDEAPLPRPGLPNPTLRSWKDGSLIPWPGRSPALTAALDNLDFWRREVQYPLAGEPPYQEKKETMDLWHALVRAASAVVETGDEVAARAGHGIPPGPKLTSNYLPIPSELFDAARVLAESNLPIIKVDNGRPERGHARARATVVRYLRDNLRTSRGRRLTARALTWLLILIDPDRFLSSPELTLRASVEKDIFPPKEQKKPRKN